MDKERLEAMRQQIVMTDAVNLRKSDSRYWEMSDQHGRRGQELLALIAEVERLAAQRDALAAACEAARTWMAERPSNEQAERYPGLRAVAAVIDQLDVALALIAADTAGEEAG